MTDMIGDALCSGDELRHGQPKLRISNRSSRFYKTILSEQISSSQNRCNLVQTAQIKLLYLSCCSLVSFLYISSGAISGLIRTIGSTSKYFKD